MPTTALAVAPSTALVPVGRDGLTARAMLNQASWTGRGVIVRHRFRGREFRHAGIVSRVDRGMVTITGRAAPNARGHVALREAVTVRIPDIVTVAWRPPARPTACSTPHRQEPR